MPKCWLHWHWINKCNDQSTPSTEHKFQNNFGRIIKWLHRINSSRPVDAYMPQASGSSLVPIRLQTITGIPADLLPIGLFAFYCLDDIESLSIGPPRTDFGEIRIEMQFPFNKMHITLQATFPAILFKSRCVKFARCIFGKRFDISFMLYLA